MGKIKTLNIEGIKAYIEHKAGALRRPFGKYLAKQEARLIKKLARKFKQQLRWILAEAKQLDFFGEKKGLVILDKKTYYDEIDKLVDGIPYNTEIVDNIVATAKPVYKKGVAKGIEELELGRYGVTFDLVNDQAVEYLEKLKTLQLSNFKGSISRTTKDKIRRILVESAETGRSYTETSKLIQAQGDEGVFSRARGELIAVNQIGRAYGQGNYDIVDAFRKDTNSIIHGWILYFIC